MLPTPQGLVFAVMLLVMLLAAVNYNNGLAYGFTFLLAAGGLVSMFHTHRNIVGLRVTVTPPTPVFAGETALFPITIHNSTDAPRAAVWLLCDGHSQRFQVGAHDTARLEVPAATRERGYVGCPPLRVASAYPFGLLYTWSAALRPRARGLVYPSPSAPLPLPSSRDQRYHDRGARRDGDDFVGLRKYEYGDPVSRIHWKASARLPEPVTKQFGGAGSGRLWIDWDATSGGNVEARLSLLCRWVIDADRSGLAYGLRLPGQTIQPGQGASHRHACLAALALWRLSDVQPA